MSEVHEVPHDAPKVHAMEWIVPALFILCAGWTIWHMPALILTFAPPEDPSAAAKLLGLHRSNDVTPGLDPIFGRGDLIDWLALIGVPLALVVGVATVRRAPMEHHDLALADRLSLFVGRVTMLLLVCLVAVMIWEVFLRYVLEMPTLWANEMSLWLAGFIFLLAGLYAMQQRAHIRIYILYDLCPRWLQRVFDVISTALILVFAFFLFWGGYGEATAKFYRWETLGTAFDPPIPAVMKPLVLIAVWLVALQAVANLIRDWNAEPEVHTAADGIDPEEVARLRRQVAGE